MKKYLCISIVCPHWVIFKYWLWSLSTVNWEQEIVREWWGPEGTQRPWWLWPASPGASTHPTPGPLFKLSPGSSVWFELCWRSVGLWLGYGPSSSGPWPSWLGFGPALSPQICWVISVLGWSCLLSLGLPCSLCSGTVGLGSGWWAPACAWLPGRSSYHQRVGKNPEVCWDMLLRCMGCCWGTLYWWTLNGFLQGRETCSETEISLAEKVGLTSVLSIPPYVLLEATTAVAQAWVKSLYLLGGGGDIHRSTLFGKEKMRGNLRKARSWLAADLRALLSCWRIYALPIGL